MSPSEPSPNPLIGIALRSGLVLTAREIRATPTGAILEAPDGTQTEIDLDDITAIVSGRQARGIPEQAFIDEKSKNRAEIALSLLKVDHFIQAFAAARPGTDPSRIELAVFGSATLTLSAIPERLSHDTEMILKRTKPPKETVLNILREGCLRYSNPVPEEKEAAIRNSRWFLENFLPGTDLDKDIIQPWIEARTHELRELGHLSPASAPSILEPKPEPKPWNSLLTKD